jgi:hypothetical protein
VTSTSEDPVEAAAREALQAVRRGRNWAGFYMDDLYSAALPAMVAAAVRANHAGVCGCWSQADNDD